jgi:hypothetical protein
MPEKRSTIGKEVQSVYFNPKYFTEERARHWVKDHKGTLKFGMDQDDKKKVMRFRQWSPRKCARFYTLDSKNSPLPRGVAYVICAERK